MFGWKFKINVPYSNSSFFVHRYDRFCPKVFRFVSWTNLEEQHKNCHPIDFTDGFLLPSSSIFHPSPPTDSKLRSNPRTRDAGKNATGILESRGVRSNRHLGPTTFHWDLHDPEADFLSHKQIGFCLNSCTQTWCVCWVFLLESGIYIIY